MARRFPGVLQRRKDSGWWCLKTATRSRLEDLIFSLIEVNILNRCSPFTTDRQMGLIKILFLQNVHSMCIGRNPETLGGRKFDSRKVPGALPNWRRAAEKSDSSTTVLCGYKAL
jgi:hypothetical protein